MRTIAEEFHQHEHQALRRAANTILGPLLLLQGEAQAAWSHVNELLPDGAATIAGTAYIVQVLILQRVAAQLAFDSGDLTTAYLWLTAHDRWLEWSGTVLGRTEGQLCWAAYHRIANDTRRARAHAESALAHATAPRQPLALLAVRRFLGELDVAEGRYGDAQAHLDTALSLADACAAPFERALCLLALAELQIATSAANDARVSLAEARAILEPLGARPALSRADTLTTALDAMTRTAIASPLPAGLSVREAEVLRLVAQGCSNAEIAARLFLSPRTVTTHLTAIYTKLGVENRAAATAFAIDHGLR